ncbi:MAG: hypothetical protein RRY78_02560, partial [Clostridia bacterium]
MANNYSDLFDLYYKNAIKAKEQNNIALAKTNLLHASQMMMNMAKESEGELKVARFERANRLLSLANNLTIENISDAMSQNGAKDTSAKAPNRAPSQSQEDDDTSTTFKSATIPTISFDDVAGLENVKSSVKNRIILPLEFP